MNSNPYINLKKTAEWKKIEKGLKDLVKNKDLIIETRLDLVVGYLVKCVIDDKQNPIAYQKKETRNG